MNDLAGVLIGLAVIFVVFLICRELVCWYWKVNRQVELLEKIHEQLKTNKSENVPPIKIN